MSASTFQVERAPLSGVKGGTAVPTPEPAAFAFPALTTTVPKEFVHRAAVAEVMLTSWKRQDDTRFTVTAQWPRAHSFFTPSEDGLHDPLIAAETVRQVGSLLAHAEYGVPLGHHFLMWRLDIAVEPAGLLVGGVPASLELLVTATDVKCRGGSLAQLGYEATVLRDGAPVARGKASFSTATPTVYGRLRGRQDLSLIRALPLTAPASPQSVGRTSPVDVVLSPADGPHRWQLRVDTRHPVLFDHPVDHVPGMVLIEAARQATAGVLERSSLSPLRMNSTFKRYVELDAPCLIEATHQGRSADGTTESVQVTARQNGAEVFTCLVSAMASHTRP
ncbi:ScbA/BarX family gamma-butyrolactone biosynthesis protein [Streptomyces incarnatus]|uniref:ScbA/BarX family gamma-butyrolactone biosynthesis protein n=1 Tax=Streptomyces incarnatus TaxID=665007 RepID=UPI000A99299E|nr:ScbA/BarX family gamma-butyrolactone biosynthesis protein [Streptomyces incarnatus]